jgi:hypothetical protein
MDAQSAPPPPPLPPAGWYPNAAGALQRWDGTAWGQVAPPPASVAAAPTTNPLGAVALTVGILAALICLIPYGVFFGGLLALGAAVLGIYAATRRAPRKLAFIGAGLGGLALLLGISITAAVAAPHPETAPQVSSTPSATPTPTPLASFNVDAPSDPASVETATVTASVAVVDNTVTNQTAIVLLSQLPVKPLQVGGYQRSADFGDAWIDVDRNGCDTRNDILARDLTGTSKSGPCKVMTGSFVSPYTAATIQFQRGENTSPLVQIDHIVALQNAWETGAQGLTYAQRVTLANDPLELLAVDGKSNNQKSGSDAAHWLPSATGFACTYVARQISVKITYGLWVTQAEHDAMARVLAGCPTAAGTASQFAPAPAPPVAAAPAQPVPFVGNPAPAAPPAAPAPAPAVHPGAYCSIAGATGVTSKGTAMVCTTTATDSRLRWRSQ